MANDEYDALNALEKEAKEYDKVCFGTPSFPSSVLTSIGC